jgi:hypothetical protein
MKSNGHKYAEFTAGSFVFCIIGCVFLGLFNFFVLSPAIVQLIIGYPVFFQMALLVVVGVIFYLSVYAGGKFDRNLRTLLQNDFISGAGPILGFAVLFISCIFCFMSLIFYMA